MAAIFCYDNCMKLEGNKRELLVNGAKKVSADLAAIRAKKRAILKTLIKKSDENKIHKIKSSIEGIE